MGCVLCVLCDTWESVNDWYDMLIRYAGLSYMSCHVICRSGVPS